MGYRIKKILTVIENNLSKPLRANDLAQLVGVSVFRLHHLFTKEIGTSLSKYIKESRFQKARELLETTDLSIKEIRVKVGLANKTHFLEISRRNSVKLRLTIAKIFTNSKNGV